MEFDEIIETSEMYTPKVKRTKVRDPESWQKNIRKKLRNTGQPYISVRGQLREGRKVREKDCSACKKNCNVNFPESVRQDIHESYWGLGDIEKQKLFISTLVEEVPVSYVRTKAQKSRRSVTRQYFMRNGKMKVPVCKGFFLTTLDISETVVSGIVKNRCLTSYFPRESLQGKSKSARARPEEAKEAIRKHIRSYIPTESGATTKKKKKRTKQSAPDLVYLSSALNAKKMYDAYVQNCAWLEMEPEKLWLYREILQKDFNIKFEDPTVPAGTVVAAAAVAVPQPIVQVFKEEMVDHPATSTTIYYEHY